MKWMFALGLIAIAVVGLWLIPKTRNDREMWAGGGVVSGSTASSPHHDVATKPSPMGTSGAHAGATEGTTGGDVITDIETITGTNDGMELVGRRVDLHVDVQARANDIAFWVGSPDNRILVVLARDTRDGVERQRGRSAPGHHAVPVRGGQRAAISGTILPMPSVEQRYSWNLTQADERELSDRKIYIRADTLTSEGHGAD